MRISVKITIATVAVIIATAVTILITTGNDGPWYRVNGTGWKKHIEADWLCTPQNDSIGIYCVKGKRGYFNFNTNEIIVPPIYDRACIFSEGLAAVQKGDSIAYINRAGQVVIGFMKSGKVLDPDSFQFHNGMSVFTGQDGNVGVIDRYGKWLIKPEYSYINAMEDCAIVTGPGKRMLVDYSGNILNAFLMDHLEELSYCVPSNERDEDGNVLYREKQTGLYLYGAGGQYGLMDSDCHRITDPLYCGIQAVDDNRFMAYLDGDSFVIIDRSGNLVK